MSTRRYPKVRTVDPPEPEVQFGLWQTKHTPGHEALIREREVYRGTSLEPVAIQHRVDFERTEHFTEVYRFTAAYLRARKTQVDALTLRAVARAEEATSGE